MMVTVEIILRIYSLVSTMVTSKPLELTLWPQMYVQLLIKQVKTKISKNYSLYVHHKAVFWHFYK
jgi:hypothetical protein